MAAGEPQLQLRPLRVGIDTESSAANAEELGSLAGIVLLAQDA